MLWDTHMHSQFSGDSQSPQEDMISAAIKKNLDESVLPITSILIIRKNRSLPFWICPNYTASRTCAERKI